MPKLNPEIIKKLQQHNLHEGFALSYLLCLYHDLDCAEITGGLNTEIHVRINLTKIFERDYTEASKPHTIRWNIPLYENESAVDSNWSWIEDWRKIFGVVRSDAIGTKKDCYTKMKKFFATNPHIRKEDIFAATNMYILSTRGSDPKYLQRADYFISKAVKGSTGVEHNSRLEMYLEIIQDSKANQAPQAAKALGQLL